MVNPADPNSIPKFVDPLPILPVLKPKGISGGESFYEVRMRQNKQRLHRDFAPTTIWGYNGQYPGPTIKVLHNQTVHVHWINDLPTTPLIPIDHHVHGAESWRPDVRNVVHLHGGHTAPQFDGDPDAWYTPGNTQIGPSFVTDRYTYPNLQPTTTLWYHDHTLGITRLTIYAGLAGFYLIESRAERALPLPEGRFDLPLLIQDRSFNPDSSLFYPPPPLVDFFGNTILVNGKVWPYLAVEPRRYRFRLLNGSNMRFYRLRLGLPFHVIGTDGGLLERPVTVNEFILAPAERVEIIVDFTGQQKRSFTLTNDAPGTFPNGHPPDANTRQVMLFQVSLSLSSPDRSEIPSKLVPLPHLGKVSRTRDLTLNVLPSGMGPTNIVLLGTRNLTGRPQPYSWGDATTERPLLGSTELWQLFNTTNDTHPIHLHLTQFRILNRQPYDANRFKATGKVVFTGPPVPPEPYEAGMKDTVRANPGEVTRIISPFLDFEGSFVWHCHMLEHEDMDMMRRLVVVRDECLGIEPAAVSHPGTLPTRST